MAIIETFSKRLKALQGGAPDVFVYDAVPQALRVQVVHIWGDAFGPLDTHVYSRADVSYQTIHDALAREWGVFTLGPSGSSYRNLAEYLVKQASPVEALDIIELSFRYLDRVVREDPEYASLSEPTVTPDAAIEELNARFLEHAVGYQYESGILVRKDSDLLHAEVVKPTLALLRDRGTPDRKRNTSRRTSTTARVTVRNVSTGA